MDTAVDVNTHFSPLPHYLSLFSLVHLAHTEPCLRLTPPVNSWLKSNVAFLWSAEATYIILLDEICESCFLMKRNRPHWPYLQPFALTFFSCLEYGHNVWSRAAMRG